MVLSEVESRAALDIKFLAIPEMVFPIAEREDLHAYVQNQLKSAGNVMSPQQSEAVLKLIESGVPQGSIIKREMSDRGGLRNLMLLALIKEHNNNVHFTMTAVSVEPHLGWRLISKKERNVWNAVLNRVADAKLKQETSKIFAKKETSQIFYAASHQRSSTSQKASNRLPQTQESTVD